MKPSPTPQNSPLEPTQSKVRIEETIENKSYVTIFTLNWPHLILELLLLYGSFTSYLRYCLTNSISMKKCYKLHPMTLHTKTTAITTSATSNTSTIITITTTTMTKLLLKNYYYWFCYYYLLILLKLDTGRQTDPPTLRPTELLSQLKTKKKSCY